MWFYGCGVIGLYGFMVIGLLGFTVMRGYRCLFLHPTATGALGNCHSGLRPGIQEAFSLLTTWLFTLDSGSKPGMTVTERHDCGWMNACGNGIPANHAMITGCQLLMFAVNYFHIRIYLIINVLPTPFQKVAFRLVKGGLLGCKRMPFAAPFAVF